MKVTDLLSLILMVWIVEINFLNISTILPMIHTSKVSETYQEYVPNRVFWYFNLKLSYKFKKCRIVSVTHYKLKKLYYH